MYELEILHQSVKRVKTKSEKVFGVNSYVCRSYRGKSGRGGLFDPPPPSILNRVKIIIKNGHYFIYNSKCSQKTLNKVFKSSGVRLNDTHREKLCFTQFSTKITEIGAWLPLTLFMFIQSAKFYTLLCVNDTDV